MWRLADRLGDVGRVLFKHLEKVAEFLLSTLDNEMTVLINRASRLGWSAQRRAAGSRPASTPGRRLRGDGAGQLIYLQGPTNVMITRGSGCLYHLHCLARSLCLGDRRIAHPPPPPTALSSTSTTILQPLQLAALSDLGWNGARQTLAAQGPTYTPCQFPGPTHCGRGLSPNTS